MILEKTWKRCLIKKESHIYKVSLNTFISTIIKHFCMSGLVSEECGAALIVASLGPGAGCEGGGGVTRHTLHSALRANCSPAAAGLHEMRVTVTPSVKLRYDVIYLIHFYDTSVFISQLFASRKLWPLC